MLKNSILYSFIFFLCIAQKLISQNNSEIVTQFSVCVPEKKVSSKELQKGLQYKKRKLNEIIELGYNDSVVVWNRLILKNTSQAAKKIMIHIPFPQLDEVIFYVGNEKYVAGDEIKNSGVFKETPSLPYTLKPNLTDTIYFSIKKAKSFLKYSVEVLPLDQFETKREADNFIKYVVVGIWFLFGLFILLLYFFHRRKYYFFYTLNTMLVITYMLVSTGTAKYLFFPEFNFYSETRLILATLTPTFFALFLSEFLCFENYFKIGKKIVMGISLLIWFSVLLLIILHDYVVMVLAKPMIVFSYSCMAGLATTLVAGMVYGIFKKKKNTWSVSISFVFTLVIMIILILSDVQLLSSVKDNTLVYLTGSYEVIFFGILLGRDYFNTLQANKKLLSEIIEEKNNTLKAYAKGEIRERKRISTLLHDEFTARISAIRMMLYNEKKTEAEREMASLAELVRTSSHLSMPAGLEEGKLMEPLENFISILRSANPQLELHLNGMDIPANIKQEWLIDLYFSITELIQNALKHGSPKKIVIELIAHEESLSVQVFDDGRGYAAGSFGFGLNNIYQRVLNYHGHFEISGDQKDGTSAVIIVPFKNT